MINESQHKPPTELNVISKAKDIVKHSYLLSNSTNHFPKKVRFTLVNLIQNFSTDILEYLFEANDLNLSIPEQKSQRPMLQAKAMTRCKQLLFLIEMSFEMEYISGSSCAYWSKMVIDVKNMTVARNRNDKLRN